VTDGFFFSLGWLFFAGLVTATGGEDELVVDDVDEERTREDSTGGKWLTVLLGW